MRGLHRLDGVATLIDGLLAVAVAPGCAACRRPLDAPLEGVVCRACWASIRPLAPPFCCVCGDHLRSWRPGRCPQCEVMRPRVSSGRAVGEYEGALRAILHAFKYGRRRTLGPALSALMREHGQSVLAGADCVVPVPLHWRRKWVRGFNQAAELARGLGPPVVHALRRTRATRTQTDLPAGERQANVRRAFALRRRPAPAGLCVVIVDDVRTTGATLDACARVLLDAGAREVRTLTAARVATRQSGPLPR